MKKERYAVVLILLALISGSALTAATSGCDSNSRLAHDSREISNAQP
ncbi:MAG: hypothetical protein KDB22_17350 [Planctomycetales bacterium]|nr:hypothetical protein [Planctomycetales bacterium]